MAYAFIISLPAPLRDLALNYYGWRLARRRFGKTFHQHLEFLMESQHWAPKQRLQFQLERLARLLKDAAEHVPFYGRHFAGCGFLPSQFASLEDLERIPPISKADILAQPNDFLHKDIARFPIERKTTSGTTGQKFSFCVPRDLASPFRLATIWRHYTWAGIKFLDRRVTLGGARFTTRPPYWSYNRSENQLLLSIHHLSEATALDYVGQIEKFAPVFLQGHPSGLALLSEFMLSRGIAYQVKAVFTTGETLAPEQRQLIEAAFRCRVFEEYGQGECVFSAQECTLHQGLREASELGVIQFLPRKDSVYAEVVGTSLWNQAMPFIRYRIEDLVIPFSAELGDQAEVTLPFKIKSVIGRVDDSLRATDGKTVLAVTIRSLLKQVLGVGETYQLKQEEVRDFVLKLSGPGSSQRGAAMQGLLTPVLGQAANVRVLFNEQVATAGGKVRSVVNGMKKTPAN